MKSGPGSTRPPGTGGIPGLVDVKDNISGAVPEYAVRVDTDRAGQYGLSIADIAQTVRIAMNGLEASKYRDGDDEYDITVRLREEDRSSLQSLDNLTIFSRGQQIPLSSVASFEETRGLGSITRLDLKRTAIIEGQAAPGFNGPESIGCHSGIPGRLPGDHPGRLQCELYR